MSLNVVIMAAGKGTRMKSALPKVLHKLAGTSLLQHVLNAAVRVGADRTVIVTGHGADEVEAATAASGAVFVRQMPQLGTGHAVQQAVPALDDNNAVTLILYGDVPLIGADTAAALVQACGRPGPGAAELRAGRPGALRPHRARRRRRRAGHRRIQGRQRRTARASARSTAASWPRPRPCSSAGWRR
jgi:CTP:molybdopterin cytidylyltransferase MocA